MPMLLPLSHTHPASQHAPRGAAPRRCPGSLRPAGPSRRGTACPESRPSPRPSIVEGDATAAAASSASRTRGSHSQTGALNQHALFHTWPVQAASSCSGRFVLGSARSAKLAAQSDAVEIPICAAHDKSSRSAADAALNGYHWRLKAVVPFRQRAKRSVLCAPSRESTAARCPWLPTPPSPFARHARTSTSRGVPLQVSLRAWLGFRVLNFIGSISGL
eukprot:6197260-Pleurochrysis_carterae.AAC.2